jgi:hypothetical protein
MIAELYYLLEHNPEFCTHTINVWKPEDMPSIQFLQDLFTLLNIRNNFLMVFMFTIFVGFLYGWNWLGAI